MKTVQLSIDVSAAVKLPEPVQIAATVFLPETQHIPRDTLAIFAVPGGGYSQAYFNLQFPGREGYSEAEFHTARGTVFIAIDHVGVGASSLPDPVSITFDVLAAAYDCAARAIAGRLEDGTLAVDFPALPRLTRVGIGQSMGGCVTIITQARHRTFAGIAPLGYSAIHTTLPQRSAEDYEEGVRKLANAASHSLDKISVAESGTYTADFVYPFHWEDVPADILEADMRGGFPIRVESPAWGSKTVPPCAVTMMAPGIVAAEAASIEVPVLIGVGERDTCPDPHAEPAAYKRSRDVSLFIVPGMAHMHNFAATRALLWARTASWAQRIAQAAAVTR
jgi:alpha-beta hydrolase superfamily lysophospholipase